MSIQESNSVACSELIELQGCKEIQTTKKGKQYSIDIASSPKILFKDGASTKRQMLFKQNCTVTITTERIFYNRDNVEIKPA